MSSAVPGSFQVDPTERIRLMLSATIVTVGGRDWTGRDLVTAGALSGRWHTLEADLAATNQILDQQDGDVVLVGHSYGGAVITEAGNHPDVAALAYIAAYAPDEGESLSTLIAEAPASVRPAAVGAGGAPAPAMPPGGSPSD